MLLSVLEIDAEIGTASLGSASSSAAILFDLAAAFLSVAGEFLQSVLQHPDIPANVRYFVRVQYEGNGCEISLPGACRGGSSTRAGIRQGCP